MKNVIVLFIVIFIGKENVSGQSVIISFDSLKVYTDAYYGTGLRLTQYNLMYSGDSVLITDNKIIQDFFVKLNSMKKESTLSNLKKIRSDFTSMNINVRAVFIFYKQSEKIVIGISPQLLMFINNTVFEKKDIGLEDIVKPSVELYKNLFPTKEEIINKN